MSCLGDGIPIQKDTFDETHFVSGVDLLPTVCDYAGIDVPNGVQGRSLRSLAEGINTPWREYAYIESNYWGRAIVTDQHKYITEYKPKSDEDFLPPGPEPNQIGVEQLFDLNKDLVETSNLVNNGAYQDAIQSCREKLFAQERQLNRRLHVHPGSKRIISNWGNRLRSYWEHNQLG